MAIGSWQQQLSAIDINIPIGTNHHGILMVMFSQSWQKRFDVFRLDGNAGAYSETPIRAWDNCDPQQLRFTFVLPPGRYRIRPAFSRKECDGRIPPSTDIAPRITSGSDAQGRTWIELFEWDFGAPGNNGDATDEKAAITLILVDNNVGYGNELPINTV